MHAASFAKVKGFGLRRILSAFIGLVNLNLYRGRDFKDELMSYDAEMAKVVADKLGLKPKFIEASRDAMLAAFDPDKADTVFNQQASPKSVRKSATTLCPTRTHTRRSSYARTTTISRVSTI